LLEASMMFSDTPLLDQVPSATELSRRTRVTAPVARFLTGGDLLGLGPPFGDDPARLDPEGVAEIGSGRRPHQQLQQAACVPPASAARADPGRWSKRLS
jgi:hypothetical protein